MFRHILYATDGSEHAKKALNYVCELARLHKSAVTVVHAYLTPTFYYSDVLAPPYYEELMERSRQMSAQLVDEAVRKLKMTSVSVTSAVIAGPPANAILKAAKDHHCDVIVMGARGLSDLQGLLLGSISHKVLQHTTCPVLVVR